MPCYAMCHDMPCDAASYARTSSRVTQSGPGVTQRPRDAFARRRGEASEIGTVAGRRLGRTCTVPYVRGITSGVRDNCSRIHARRLRCILWSPPCVAACIMAAPRGSGELEAVRCLSACLLWHMVPGRLLQTTHTRARASAIHDAISPFMRPLRSY